MAEADRSKRHSQDLLHILGFGTIRRTCKLFVSKCHTVKNPSLSKKTDKAKPRIIQEDLQNSLMDTNQNPKDGYSEDKMSYEIHDSRLKKHFSFRGLFKHKGSDDTAVRDTSPPVARSTSPSPFTRHASRKHPALSRTTSLISQKMTPTGTSSLLRTMSRRNSIDGSSSGPLPRTLSRNTSKRNPTIIMYSNSNGLVKPPPMEKELDCTLDELCFGCIRKVKITRDAVTDDGQIIEEDEVLTIKVKPGWRKGTKITFEGMGNKTPGTGPADVIFTIAEKEHPLFRRDGDDLELGVKIPLVEALTGCITSVPLLGEQAMSLTVDDVIYPGYEKIIAGQGMPKHNEPEIRGNLKITFLIEFPQELTEEQRSDVANILQDSCY